MKKLKIAMNKKRNIKSIFVFIFSILFFVGCQTIAQPKEVFEQIDYTNEDVKQNEIKNIREILKTEPVKRYGVQ